MNEFEPSTLNQAHSPRRGFLGKLLSGGAALAALPVLSSITSAQDGPRDRPGDNNRNRNPAEMAAAMIKRFDRDGDHALNRRELTEALTALLRHRRGGQGNGGGQGGGNNGQGQQGARARGQGKGRGAGQRGKGRGQQGGGEPKIN